MVPLRSPSASSAATDSTVCFGPRSPFTHSISRMVVSRVEPIPEDHDDGRRRLAAGLRRVEGNLEQAEEYVGFPDSDRLPQCGPEQGGGSGPRCGHQTVPLRGPDNYDHHTEY